MVKALSAQSPDHSLRDGVCLWCADWRGNSVDSDTPGAVSEIADIDGLAIAEQMPRFLAPRRGLEELPPHPRCCRAGRHVDLHQLTPPMRDEHQHVQRLERQRRHGKEVSSPYVMRVVAQERAPCLARRAPPSTPAITPNRAIADDDAQLGQVASDPLSTPGRLSLDMVAIRSRTSGRR
jgi:hypothetical protein